MSGMHGMASVTTAVMVPRVARRPTYWWVSPRAARHMLEVLAATADLDRTPLTTDTTADSGR